MIAKLAENSEELRFIWKSAEIQLSQLEARLHLECKAKESGLTQSDLKARVESDDQLYAKRMDALTLESAYKKALIEVDKWVNAFTASRKKASLEIEQMRNLNDSVRPTITKGDRNGQDDE